MLPRLPYSDVKVALHGSRVWTIESRNCAVRRACDRRDLAQQVGVSRQTIILHRERSLQPVARAGVEALAQAGHDHRRAVLFQEAESVRTYGEDNDPHRGGAGAALSPHRAVPDAAHAPPPDRRRIFGLSLSRGSRARALMAWQFAGLDQRRSNTHARGLHRRQGHAFLVLRDGRGGSGGLGAAVRRAGNAGDTSFWLLLCSPGR